MIPQELLYMRRLVSFQARFGRTLGRLSAKKEYLSRPGLVQVPTQRIPSIITQIPGLYSGRTKYSAFVSKLNKLSEEYLSPQKTQKAAFFFYWKDLRQDIDLKS